MNTEIKEKILAYMGPEGSYTEIALEKAIKLYGFEKTKKVMFPSIVQVIEYLDNNNGYAGVVPIENSIEGIVRETVDNLIRTTSRVMITGEIYVPISHCLISKTDNISSINKIISHPQALAQCIHFIKRTFPDGVEQIKETSTSEAVKNLIELPLDYAAIGTAKAAEIFGLKIIAKDINDEKDNMTRFVYLDSSTPKPTGDDKTSFAFSTCNKPGALVGVLQSFNESGINLSYIESRPSKKVFGDYTFFIDFEGHIEDENVQKTIGKIAPLVSYYRFLGSYPKGLK
jgi:prephenate dehydratase